MPAALVVPTIFTAVDRITSTVKNITKSVSSFSEQAMDVAKNTGIASLAIAAPFALMTKAAIDFEDRLADVAKTTGLSGLQLKKFGDGILSISKSTRTSIDDLITIGEIGGQLGIATKDLMAFTKASNIFSVALGEDYGGTENAITQVGKIKNLFKETKNIDVASAITKAGSVINQLGSVGAATSENLNDFILRLGALPASLKPSLQSTAALGALFEELGLNSEISAGGLTNFFLVAGKNLGLFAQQMRITKSAAQNLLANDSTGFAKMFSLSTIGLKPDQLAKRFKMLGIGTQETIKVIGALASGTDRLTALQLSANDAFEKGTSLQSEYNTKNSTTAATLKKVENNIQVLTIKVGTQLIPILNKLLDKLLPILDRVITWTDNNKKLTGSFIKIALSISAFLGVISILSVSIANIVKLYKWWIALKVLYLSSSIATTAAIWAEAAAMAALRAASAGGFVFGGGASLGRWAVAFGAVGAAIGIVISYIATLQRNWDTISKAFTSKGLLAGLASLGRALTVALISPIQEALKWLGKLTGFEWISNFAKNDGGPQNRAEWDKWLANPNFKNEPKPRLPKPEVAAVQNNNQSEGSKNFLQIDLNDPGKMVNSTNYTGPMVMSMPKLTSTTGNK